MSRTLLVTGGCGFIGSNFVRAVLGQRRDWSVVNLDALTYAGNLESLRDVEGDPRYRFIHGDVRNRSVVDAAIRG
ncbi:MAG: GDP-mannose 4,6-dehydratase, partial [Planctomycetota bacterium]